MFPASQQSTTHQSQINGHEMELPLKMACLDICEHEPEAVKHVAQGETRNVYFICKKPLMFFHASGKRRCTLKPKKMIKQSSFSEYCINESQDIASATGHASRTLETIFEEPLVRNGCTEHMGSLKLRKLQFNTKSKASFKLRWLKMRKTKSLKLRKKRKATMDEFIARFHELRMVKEDTPDQNT